ncbi:putative centromere protein Mis12 [Medicago truncatula]|uniref:Kinetochore-like protein n=1 Tax=Medicago truncatula TaxID=3880 RepID=G7JT34_MEDTR|nr:protein MIS12 homolog isoform X1 [Medicago truncatula]AES91356.1 kinetochore-like protein [Medicago truncatula]RHN63785.1 putative centromere protein Mis12 [Medicago truncatula]
MEGSESEAVFESVMNLNPQLFFNEVLNTVDDFFIDTFDFYFQEASTKLNAEATQRSQHLTQGVDCIRQKVQSVLDQKLTVWEKYCLYHCFSLPQGFQLPNTLNGERSANDINPGSTSDLELDAQLESLRKKLAEVGKESEMLNQEIHALESQSSHNARYINEAVQLFEQNSYTELFQEIMTTASELQLKIGKLTTNKIEGTGKMKAKRIDNNKMDISAIYASKGLSNTKFEDLQEFVTLMKST